jgi:glutathione peroxidase
MEAPMTAHDFEFTAIDGGKVKLKDFAGKPVLIVNTASECGLTPQYKGLQDLHEKYSGRGLVVLGVPSNDFGRQEPGTEAEIKNFCTERYHVSFPMTAKYAVVGAQAHPFYKWVTDQAGEAAAPHWNFHKYLIDSNGHLAGSFPSKMTPEDPSLAGAIEAQLKH